MLGQNLLVESSGPLNVLEFHSFTAVCFFYALWLNITEFISQVLKTLVCVCWVGVSILHIDR